MSHNSSIKLYAGPSLSAKSQNLIKEYKIEWHNPIRRFDLDKLVDQGFHGKVVIADGYFYQDMSVGHAEIRRAIESGCRIYGLSSMGAIRAFEMQSFGMIGYGKVFDWFCREDDFQDDEVALLHEPEPSFRAISEPMVHFRECINQLEDQNQIDNKTARTLISRLKERFFGERTLSLFANLLNESTAIDTKRLIDDFDAYRIKKLDLENFLESKRWMSA